jgi:polysaccharide biosynthesis/export protein
VSSQSQIHRLGTALVLASSVTALAAQAKPPAGNAPAPPVKSAAPSPQAPPPGSTPGAQQLPSDYVIGPDDVLSVFFWREKDLTGDVAVRPDGKVTLPLLNEIQAAGLRPDELRVAITEAAKKYFEDPTVTISVKTINSRKVFVSGQVGKTGVYPLMGPMTVSQMLTLAGGPLEYADTKNIGIVRRENGKPVRVRFNYEDWVKGKNLTQDIELKPGDQIIVP